VPIKRKSTRLPEERYLGQRAYFITICCDHRQNYLSDPHVAKSILSILFSSAAPRSFLIHAYCLMPDHAQMLAQGIHPTSDLLEFIRVFKQRTAYQFKREKGKKLWELSYHDHILRKPLELEDVACYIWWNPVRKGLCQQPSEYPYSGSQTITWMNVSRTSPK
jgi:putative transposase